MDPLLTLAGGTPVPADEEGMAEYEAAAGWARHVNWSPADDFA